MRAGKITSLSERGTDADLGRHRLTFFSEHRRFRLVVDDSGTILQRSALDFGDAPLPKSVRKPGRVEAGDQRAGAGALISRFRLPLDLHPDIPGFAGQHLAAALRRAR